MHLSGTGSDRRLIGVIGAAVVGGMVLLYVGRHLWFFGDEWDFLLHRSLGSASDLLRPHNEHWSTIPIVIYRVLFSGFSASTYFPYFVTLVALHIALAGAVGTILLRAGAPTLLAALAAFGVATFGPGGENLLWSFQIGFTTSLLLGVVAFLLLDQNRRWTDFAASGAVLLALASSGVGVPVLVAISSDLALRRQFRRCVVVAAGPAAAYVLWLAFFGATASSTVLDNPIDTLLLLPAYVVTGLSAAISGLIGFGIGSVGIAVLVLVALVAAWVLGRDDRIPHVVASALFAAVWLYVASGATRVAMFGVSQASASRYVHIGGVLLVLGGGSAFFQSKVWARFGAGAGRWWLAVTVIVALIANLAVLRDVAVWRNDLSDDTRSGVLGMAAALGSLRAGEFIVGARPVPGNPDVDAGTLHGALEDGSLRFPSGAVESVASVTSEEMRALMSMRILAEQPSGEPVLGLLVAANDVVRSSPSDACSPFKPTGSDPFVVLDIRSPGWIAVDVDGAGALEVFLRVGEEFIPLALEDVSSTAGRRWIEIVGRALVVRLDPPDSAVLTLCTR